MHLLFGLADGRLATSIRRRAVVAGYVAAVVVGVALDGRARPPGRLADRRAVGARPRLRPVRQPRPLRQGRCRRPPAHAVGRLGDGGGHRGRARRRRPAPAHRLAAPGGRRRPRPHRPDPDRPHPRHPADDGGPRRPPAHPHRRDRRADGRRRRRSTSSSSSASAALRRTTSGRCSCCRWSRPGCRALLYLPARRWLTERANRLVYGERFSPDELLRTFGQRLTRSIPMDELLLQLVESLRKAMVLVVGRGVDGTGRPLRARRRRPPSPGDADR